MLYGGNLSTHAFEEALTLKNRGGPKSAIQLAWDAGRAFPGVAKQILLIRDTCEGPFPMLDSRLDLVTAQEWTKKKLLDALADCAKGFDLIYFAWADCPLLDSALAERLAARHTRFAAEYSYADGWPEGFAPELLSPALPSLLSGLIQEENERVGRDALFSVIQKDINAFDIEAEISPVDLRQHRLTLAADSKRNLQLVKGLMDAGLTGAEEAERIIGQRPELLRTLPSFFPIQTVVPCPQRCSMCPYPAIQLGSKPERDFMPPEQFESLLERIIRFAGDGVIDMSLWGELALHPQKMELIRMVLARAELSLIIETAGLGWTEAELDTLGALAAPRERATGRGALSWIVSLDAADSAEYQALRGAGFSVACETAQSLMQRFPQDTYVQAIRMTGGEDGIERFYRYWKDRGAQIIIQKYDDFCGALPKKQATDLSPIIRQPCWHLMRDMNILIDGTVPFCREDLNALSAALNPLGKGAVGESLGNAFLDSLETIWSHGAGRYLDHCSRGYAPICEGCDEYYTFNF